WQSIIKFFIMFPLYTVASIDSELSINVDNPFSSNYQVNFEGVSDANVNDTVNCKFGFSRNEGVMSGSFILSYDEEKVRFQGVTANQNVEGLMISYNKIEKGKVKVAYAFSKCYNLTMNFLNIQFVPLEKSTSSNISLSDVTITNEQLQECTFDGSYEATISTSEQQSDNLFTVNGLDSIDSQETFDVTINLAGNSGIASMTAYLEYDKDIFEIQDASFSDGILKNSFTNVSTSTKGKVKFAFMSTGNIKADGQVIKLTFKATKNENVTGKFQLVVDELTDSNATNQECNISNLTTKVNKICIHNYIGPDFQWSSDYSTCKAVYTCEYNSEHVVGIDCDVQTKRTEPTCEEDGSIVHTATGKYNNETITDTKTEKLEAKGHIAGETKIENATESTCEVGGSYDEVVYCTVCGKELSRTTIKTEAKGHKWNEGKVTTEPTCTEEGVKTFECTVCGKTKTEKV
ncbi:cohesin domain-containing protein, partial [Eubacterium ventriosum]|uniref:cohesin domain-containing protein n=1 Tax=Eubacterium ventriosum TaxID=39496 RepID=UPI0039949F98